MAKGDEGLSTQKKVVAGAALGVAIPAAIGVAKKLAGEGEPNERYAAGDVLPSSKEETGPTWTAGFAGGKVGLMFYPATLLSFVFSCAMHYHAHSMARRMVSGRTAVFSGY